jgi:ABC-type sugar transport system, ATPase component
MSEPTPSVPVVEAFEVTKRFGSTAALKDVSIRVMPGESHALVGRNGAGKSTLVSILTGLRKPDPARCVFGGRPRRRSRIAMRGASAWHAFISIRRSFAI